MTDQITAYLLSLFEALTPYNYVDAPPRLQVGIDYHRVVGLVQFEPGDHDVIGDTPMNGWYVSMSGLYNIDRHFSTGIGVGIGTYRPEDNIRVPIYASFRYRPWTNSLHELYAFTDVGLAIEKNGAGFSPGFICHAGIGWQRLFHRHFGINLQLAYNLDQFRVYTSSFQFTQQGHDIHYELNPYGTAANLWRHSVAFGVGLVF